MKKLIELKGNWHVLKGKMKQKYAILSDSDLMLLEGKEEELLGRLQQRLGKTREELEKVISEL